MNATGSASSPNATLAYGPFASSRYNMPIGVVCVHFIAGLYIPIFLVLFIRRRKFPSVRQTNPAHVVVISTFGGIYCLGTAGALLVYDILPISIGAYALVTTACFLWTMFAAFSSDVVLVCTYFQTKWTVDIHANMKASVPSDHLVARCKLLQRILAPRPLLATSILLHILWTLPYGLQVLISAESSFWRIETSWSAPLAADLVHVTVLQCAFLLAGTTFLGYLLGSVNEAFALRRVYVSAARRIAACFIGYLITVVVVPPTKPTLRTTIATSITHVAVHVVVFPLLVRPVVRSRHEVSLALSSAHFMDKESWEAVNADLLTLFLATPDGTATYLAFTQVQLLPVAWLLAYRDIKSRLATPQALYNTYLRTDSVLCMRAFVPEAIRGELDITFTRNVITSTSDDLYVMYDPLVTRLLRALVLHTLPQLLHHPLGNAWHAFVETYGGQYSPDDLLLNGAGYLGPFGVRRPLGTILSQATYVSSRFSTRRQSRYSSSRVSMSN